MINSTDISGKFALDVNDLSSLKSAAKQNSPEALKSAAKQFEALFMNMVMKSMRDASPQDGPLDNDQSKMYTTMLDQQISQKLANRGVGLADMLVRQLSNNKTGAPSSLPSGQPQVPASGADISNSAASFIKLDPLRMAQIAAFQQQSTQEDDAAQITGTGLPEESALGQIALDAAASVATDNRTGGKPRAKHIKAFEDLLAADAAEASNATGIPAKFMLGQAALETGWGKHEIKSADGSPSHNLFGIKATAGWKGKVVQAVTTEYVNGMPQTKMEKFRAYDSYADGFKDYAKLLSNNPRYGNVIANSRDASSFAHGLQRAGYATDPNYAAKLTRLIQHSLSA